MTWRRLGPRGAREREGTAQERDPAASMALLEEVLDPPVGPGYRSAADKRLEQGLAASSGTRTWLMLAVSVLLGLLFTAAATTLGGQDEAAAKTRTQLVERIEAAQATGDAHRETVEQLRAELL